MKDAENKQLVTYYGAKDSLIKKLAEQKYKNTSVNIDGVKTEHGKVKRLKKTYSNFVVIEFEVGNEILSFSEIDILRKKNLSTR